MILHFDWLACRTRDNRIDGIIKIKPEDKIAHANTDKTFTNVVF